MPRPPPRPNRCSEELEVEHREWAMPDDLRLRIIQDGRCLRAIVETPAHRRRARPRTIMPPGRERKTVTLHGRVQTIRGRVQRKTTPRVLETTTPVRETTQRVLETTTPVRK